MLKALRVTIDVFSGRQNPSVELTGNEARNAIERLHPAHRIERGEKALPTVSTLGYRGLVIEQVGERVKALPTLFRYAHGEVFGPDLAHHAKDEAFEDFILESTRIKELKKPQVGVIKKEIDRFRDLRQKWEVGKIKWPPWKPSCKCAPIYEPTWWNTPAIQPHNNCYNYSTNYRSDTYAQPGLAAGAMYTAITCAAVRAAAIKDELIDTPTAGNTCPAQGHRVALVIWPDPNNPNDGVDFHWYRKGSNKYWSHKPGGGQATNLDNSGAIIPNPATADRGPYTEFCGYMVVKHGHIKIQ